MIGIVKSTHTHTLKEVPLQCTHKGRVGGPHTSAGRESRALATDARDAFLDGSDPPDTDLAHACLIASSSIGPTHVHAHAASPPHAHPSTASPGYSRAF